MQKTKSLMRKRLLAISVAVFCFSHIAKSQENISGAICVVIGTQYSYFLSGSAANYNYCIVNGTLSTGGTCGSGTGYSKTIYVTWAAATPHTITLYSTTNTATLTAATAITLVPGAISSGQTQAINNGAIPAAINCAASTGGGCGAQTYSYQWQSSPNNVTYTNISGATGVNLTFSTGLTSTTYYRRMVTVTGTSAYSNVATVTVYAPLIPGTVTPASQTINFNSTGTTLVSSGVSGGTNSYTYLWQYSSDNTNWLNTAGVAATYGVSGLTSDTYFRLAVSSNGVTAYSGSVIVHVNPQVFGGTVGPTFILFSSGNTPGPLSGGTASGGGCGGSYIYQWQTSSDGVNFTNISGANSLNYLPGSLIASTWFRRQVNCSSDLQYSNIIQAKINSGAPPDMNFIRTRTILKAGVADTTAAITLTSPYDVSQSTQYFDGIGRPVQTVAMQQSPLQKDIVAYNTYDYYGREAYKYLPFISGSSDGNYKPTYQSDEYNFNNGQFPGEQYYYSLTNFEPSPLDRVSASYPQGMSWAGANRGVGIQYLVNQTADSVRIWSIANTAGSIPVTTATYLPGTLYKTITTDEASHQTVEYKNLLNQVILKKVQLAATPGTAHAGWLCTYYIYDTLNNLRFVIQPQGVVTINTNWVITAAVASELCFRYEYDSRKRMTVKKIPGAGETWMVYDARDRVVMSQDSSLRLLQKWQFTRYDSQNRPDSTGLITDPANYNHLSYHQGLASTSGNYPVVSAYTNELLTQTFYDDYLWAGGTGLTSSMATGLTSTTNFITSYNVSPVYAVNPMPSYIVRGMVTGSMKKAMDVTNRLLYDVSFYDDHGRVVQNMGINYTGAIDTTTFQFNFGGKPLRNLLGHKKNNNTVQAHRILTKMDYDAGFRLKRVWKNIDNAPVDQLIDSMQYNELGQLRAKYLGNNLDSLVYIYNIRGWLTSINRPYLTNVPGSYFGMELGYDWIYSAAGTAYAVPQYNGNIAGTVWKSAGDSYTRKYDFTYDNVNRLTGADFNQNSGLTFDKTGGVDFSVGNLTYDANGNIMSMNQNGYTVGGSATIDQLTYTYQLNSNKLSQVTDAAPNNSTSKLGDFHYSGTKGPSDYNYDGNGNLITDNNKMIDRTSYNYLNLPTLVHLNSKGNVQYVYDGLGNKLQKITTDSLNRHITTTMYLGAFVYQRTDSITTPNTGVDTLQFIGHEEGRVRWAFHKYTSGYSAYGFEYDFFENDHLGNTRIVLTQQKDTAKYLASGEAAYRATENQLFSNLNTTTIARTSAAGYPADLTITNPNDTVFRVNGTAGGKKTGPALLLRVMSGDKIDLSVQYYYNTGSTSPPGSSIPDILASLATGISNMSAGGKGTVADLNNTSTSPVYAALNSFMGANESTPASKPKAYLNWILLDEQLKYVASYPQSGAMVVGNAGLNGTSLQTPLGYSGIPINKNGFIYIWVSNETPNWDVFFDNLRVTHYSGPELEESHYYPFGLTMAGISSKALKTNYAENKYKFNKGSELQSKEFTDGSGLELYETPLRSLDPQLGRWWQIDPKPDCAQSPYSSMNNNPILLSDPLGDTTWVYNQNGVLSGVVSDNLKNQIHFIKTDGDPGSQFSLKGLSKKDLNAVGKAFRKNSFAFIGMKTVSDMQKIDNKSESIGKEVSFVGKVGSDKEIRLTALPIDNRNHSNNDAAGSKINEQFPDAQSQSSLVLWGHTHVVGDWSTLDANPQKTFGDPSPGTANGDYGNVLYRNGTNQIGPSPALVGTKYGITVYGSNEVYSNNSYLLYKSLKK